MSKKTKKIGGKLLKTQQPTELDFNELYTWTLWQFPRKVRGGFCGAVHPPITDHGWFPAIIQVKEKKAQIYAHMDEIFDTPEEAAKFLEK